MRRLSVVLALAMLPGSAARLRAHEGHEHKVLGTVAVLDASHLELKDKDGKTVSVRLTPETRYLNGKLAAAAADVRVGQRVAVFYIEKDKVYLAMRVLLGVTEPAGAGEKKTP